MLKSLEKNQKRNIQIRTKAMFQQTNSNTKYKITTVTLPKIADNNLRDCYA